MKQSEFLKWLKKQGVTATQGTKHLRLHYNGKSTILPRHPSQELPTGTVEAVKKQLGLK